MSWQRKLGRLRAEVRDWAEVVLLVRITILAVVLPALLRCIRLPALLRFLTPSPRRRRRSVGIERATHLTDLVLARLPQSRKSCLIRSLILVRILSGCGIPVHIHVGVRRLEGRLSGHSWLSCQGRPFADTAQAGFVEMLVYPPLARIAGAQRQGDPS